MITNFSVTNFKSFAAEAEATLGNLLVVSGPNSCGKTTLIQALLLLSQSLDNNDPQIALDLGGQYVQFAEFRDAVFGRPQNSKAQFSVCFESNRPSLDFVGVMKRQPTMYSGQLRANLRAPIRRQNSDLGLINVSNKYRVRITFGATTAGIPFVKQMSLFRQIDGKFEISHELDWKGNTCIAVTRSQPIGAWSHGFNFRDAESNIENTIYNISEAVDFLNRNTRRKTNAIPDSIGAFSRRLLVSYGVQDSPFLQSLYKNKKNICIPDNTQYPPQLYALITTLAQSIFDYGSAQKVNTQINIKRGEIFLGHFMPLTPGPGSFYFPSSQDSENGKFSAGIYSAYAECFQDIKGYLRRIYYLGPLRAKPEKAYLPTGTPSDMGNAGEYAVPFLWLNRAEKISFKTRPGQPEVRDRLDRAVTQWFEEFGIAHSLSITKPKRVIYQAELDGPEGTNIKVTIADVGFGVSQLLPVILKGLLAPPGSTLIFEQPEIHLHPKLQAKLADFFICLVELKKRVIVETHSEHLINMLRLRIVEDHTCQLQEQVRISFVQAHTKTNDSNANGSFITNLELDQYGQITNWPPDFFPEHGDITEKILMAMLAKS